MNKFFVELYNLCAKYVNRYRFTLSSAECVTLKVIIVKIMGFGVT